MPKMSIRWKDKRKHECVRNLKSYLYQFELGEKCSDQQWVDVDQLKPRTSSSDPSKSSVLFLKWTGSRAREGNSWTHALIMLYFRWYPVVSHFNNPPQLDVLVPSARQCLPIGPGWEPCWGLTTSTLMESTMRDTHPIFIVSHACLVFSPSLSQMAPPGCWGCHGQGSKQGMAGRGAT